MKLRGSKVRFTAYGSKKLSLMGSVKLILKNANGYKVRSVAYGVQGGNESLLGRRDGEALGIIKLDLRGRKPDDEKDKSNSLKNYCILQLNKE